MAPGSPLTAEFACEAVEASVRSVLVLIILLGVSGCAWITDFSKEPIPVSVSAANYSQLSDEELYARVHNDPVNSNPEPPDAPKPSNPVYYLLLPGEVYPSDVPVDTMYRELETSLESKGYFNAVYQVRAGHITPRIDYLLRVHYGERTWLTPIVRKDRVTWGNDGLVANRSKVFLKANVMGRSVYDPRVGLSQEEEMTLHQLEGALMSSGGGPVSGSHEQRLVALSERQALVDDEASRDYGGEDTRSRDFFLFVVEAFKFEDVRTMDKKAPCIWATFIAVPAEHGQKLSSLLRTMLQTGTPYFGATTHGLQIYEVPPGKVLMGIPVEVPGPQKTLQPSGPTLP